MFDLVVAGALFIIVGLIVAAISLFDNSRNEGVKGAGVVLIGPVPIVFGSDAKWASVAIGLTIVLLFLVFGLRMV